MSTENQRAKPNYIDSLNQLKLTLDPKGRAMAHSMLYPMLLVGVSGQAVGGIVKTNPAVPLTYTNNGNLDWDIDGDGSREMFFADCGAGSSSSVMMSITTAGFNFVSSGLDLQAITAGSVIGAGSSFGGICGPTESTSGSVIFNGFNNYATGADFGGIFGFQFNNAGTTNYGIARFAFASWDGSDPLDGTFSLLEWAYEDSGEAIAGNALDDDPTVAVAPTAALMGLALGAMGLRRRREQAERRH